MSKGAASLSAELQSVKKAHVNELFQEAMSIREQNPKKALKLFEKVVKLDPAHCEARLKISWVLLKIKNFNYDFEALLTPITMSGHSTLDEKQRAFTNLSCSIAFNPKDTRYALAEKYAQDGIDLDHRGTNRLWENLGNALRRQGKLDAAHKAFEKAAALNPNSKNALLRKQSIDKFLDPTKHVPSNPIDRIIQERDFTKKATMAPQLTAVTEDETPQWMFEMDGVTSSSPPTKHGYEEFLLDDKPLPKDRPCVLVGDRAILVESGTTLADLRESHGACHVEHQSETGTRYYRDAFVLDDGEVYALIADQAAYGLDSEEASILLVRMEKHLQRMARSAVRQEKSINIGKLSIPLRGGRDYLDDFDDERKLSPRMNATSPTASKTVGTLRKAHARRDNESSTTSSRRRRANSDPEVPELNLAQLGGIEANAISALGGVKNSPALRRLPAEESRKHRSSIGKFFNSRSDRDSKEYNKPGSPKGSRGRRDSSSIISDARLFSWLQPTAFDHYLLSDQNLQYRVRSAFMEKSDANVKLARFDCYVECYYFAQMALEKVGSPKDKAAHIIETFVEAPDGEGLDVEYAVLKKITTDYAQQVSATLNPFLFKPLVTLLRPLVVVLFAEWQATQAHLRTTSAQRSLWHAHDTFPVVVFHDVGLYDAFSTYISVNAPDSHWMLECYKKIREVAARDVYDQPTLLASAKDTFKTFIEPNAKYWEANGSITDEDVALMKMTITNGGPISSGIFLQLLASLAATLSELMGDFQNQAKPTTPKESSLIKRIRIHSKQRSDYDNESDA